MVGAIVVTATLWIGLGATSASAATEIDSAQIEVALANAGVETSLEADSVTIESGATVTEVGLTLPIGDSDLPADVITTTPVTHSSAASVTPDGLALFASTDSSAFALSAFDAAGYSISFDSGAPLEYSYDIGVGDEPTTLKLVEGGGVSILKADGTLVNSILPPWAKDATGAEIPTYYTVEGNTLTQHVEHQGAVYPVVADPRYVCSGVFCTLELSRSDTRKLADNILSVGGAHPYGSGSPSVRGHPCRHVGHG